MTNSRLREFRRLWSRRGASGSLAILAVLIGSLALACRGDDHRAAAQRFIPSRAEARNSLDRALSSWRDAAPDASARPGTGALTFVDHQRKPGQALRSYQVLGEQPCAYARQFRVKLVLGRPDESMLATYVVFGHSPRWVYRLEDFEMMMHWEHPMEPTTAAAGNAAGDGNPTDGRAESRRDGPGRNAQPNPVPADSTRAPKTNSLPES